MSQVVVVIGGGAVCRRASSPTVDDDAAIIAADSGLDHAVPPGLRPTVLVGDLDSISRPREDVGVRPRAGDRRAPRRQGLHRHRAGAASSGRRPSADNLLVFGAAGDRFDHALGTIAALGNAGTRSAFQSIRLLLDETAGSRAARPGGRSPIDLPATRCSRCSRCTVRAAAST